MTYFRSQNWSVGLARVNQECSIKGLSVVPEKTRPIADPGDVPASAEQGRRPVARAMVLPGLGRILGFSSIDQEGCGASERRTQVLTARRRPRDAEQVISRTNLRARREDRYAVTKAARAICAVTLPPLLLPVTTTSVATTGFAMRIRVWRPVRRPYPPQ